VSAAAKLEECGRLGPAAAAPEASAEASAPPPPRGAKKARPVEASAPTVDDQLAGVEKEIFGAGGCGKCHTLSQPASGLPEVAPTAIPTRWLPRSVFDHGVHRTLSCPECHGRARTSTETADVLLPSISTCRTCHRASGGARTGCVECHLYHDKTLERDPNGPRTIPRLVRSR
jgi:hypothetical protein